MQLGYSGTSDKELEWRCTCRLCFAATLPTLRDPSATFQHWAHKAGGRMCSPEWRVWRTQESPTTCTFKASLGKKTKKTASPVHKWTKAVCLYDQVRKAVDWLVGFSHALEAVVETAHRQWEVRETTLPEERHPLVGGAGGGEQGRRGGCSLFQQPIRVSPLSNEVLERCCLGSPVARHSSHCATVTHRVSSPAVWLW